VRHSFIFMVKAWLELCGLLISRPPACSEAKMWLLLQMFARSVVSHGWAVAEPIEIRWGRRGGAGSSEPEEPFVSWRSRSDESMWAPRDDNAASLLLIQQVSNVHPSTKSLFHFNEIWHVGRSRRVMHDGMQYDPIQGQGHEPLNFFGNPAIFKRYLVRHLQWELATDHWFLN